MKFTTLICVFAFHKYVSSTSDDYSFIIKSFMACAGKLKYAHQHNGDGII
jgi:hypothetical protein